MNRKDAYVYYMQCSVLARSVIHGGKKVEDLELDGLIGVFNTLPKKQQVDFEEFVNRFNWKLDEVDLQPTPEPEEPVDYDKANEAAERLIMEEMIKGQGASFIKFDEPKGELQGVA